MITLLRVASESILNCGIMLLVVGLIGRQCLNRPRTYTWWVTFFRVVAAVGFFLSIIGVELMKP